MDLPACRCAEACQRHVPRGDGACCGACEACLHTCLAGMPAGTCWPVNSYAVSPAHSLLQGHTAGYHAMHLVNTLQCSLCYALRLAQGVRGEPLAPPQTAWDPHDQGVCPAVLSLQLGAVRRSALSLTHTSIRKGTAGSNSLKGLVRSSCPRGVGAPRAGACRFLLFAFGLACNS